MIDYNCWELPQQPKKDGRNPRGLYYTFTKELNQNKFKKGDTEGFVNYGLSLLGISLAVILIENEAEKIIKMSFRSKGSFDVNHFAKKYFNGGGHINAAAEFRI